MAWLSETRVHNPWRSMAHAGWKVTCLIFKFLTPKMWLPQDASIPLRGAMPLPAHLLCGPRDGVVPGVCRATFLFAITQGRGKNNINILSKSVIAHSSAGYNGGDNHTVLCTINKLGGIT